MPESWITAPAMLTIATDADMDETPVSIFEDSAQPTPEGRIDELVFRRLQQLRIQPANLCSDTAFLRRAYLDVIGTLPTAEEASEFLANREPNRRAALIDRLLLRNEFADYWAMKWSDLLRIKAEFPINLWPNAAQAYYQWVRTSIAENKPYDRFVREMMTANGSNFRDPQVNFYRAVQNKEPKALAQAVALTFMGMRTEKWPDGRLADMAVFFSQIGYKATGEWKEEIVFFDPDRATVATASAHLTSAKISDVAATFPDGTHVLLRSGKDPREAFADWLVSAKNPWFTKNIVNRIWSWLLGRGIVHEPDDVREDNPPENPELLAFLEQELIAANYDLKHIYRLILNSKTYQLSSIPRSDNPEGEKHFAHYVLRRLDAEVLIDALCEVTGSGEQYTSAVPEPYTVMPEDQRSISLPDGSISSSFLELFGRPPRDTGLESERNNQPTASQRLHLLNSTHIERKIEQSPKLQELVRRAKDPGAVVNSLYLTILSRYPTPEEMKFVQTYSESGNVNRRQAITDLAWALMNTSEFLYRH